MVDYEKIAQERNMQNGFINRIGFKVTEIGKLYAKGEIDLGEMHANPIGSIHGGVIFSMADTVGGVAATTAGSYCTTVNGNINYLNVATNLAWFELTGQAEDIDREVDNYRSVTAEQLHRVAQQTFRDENGIVLYYQKENL